MWGAGFRRRRGKGNCRGFARSSPVRGRHLGQPTRCDLDARVPSRVQRGSADRPPAIHHVPRRPQDQLSPRAPRPRGTRDAPAVGSAPAGEPAPRRARRRRAACRARPQPHHAALRSFRASGPRQGTAFRHRRDRPGGGEGASRDRAPPARSRSPPSPGRRATRGHERPRPRTERCRTRPPC